MKTGGYGGSMSHGDSKRVTTNRQTLKTAGKSHEKVANWGNKGNTKGTTLPGNGRPANSKVY